MDNKKVIATTNVSIIRLLRKILLNISSSVWIPSTKRYLLLRLGGVNIKGPCFIGAHVTVDTIRPDLITIGEGCCITSGTVILSHFIKDDCMYYGPVTIGKRVFIGINTIIANSIIIGDGALIGAGSIVTKDIPTKEVWAGNPAHFIKQRNIEI